MKNKKGFTLIEILGVLIILALISLLTFPKIVGQVQKIKNNISKNEEALIIDAAKDYEHDHGLNCVNVGTLHDEGYLSIDKGLSSEEYRGSVSKDDSTGKYNYSENECS